MDHRGVRLRDDSAETCRGFSFFLIHASANPNTWSLLASLWVRLALLILLNISHH